VRSNPGEILEAGSRSGNEVRDSRGYQGHNQNRSLATKEFLV
jgi:hypothetical protein